MNNGSFMPYIGYRLRRSNVLKRDRPKAAETDRIAFSKAGRLFMSSVDTQRASRFVKCMLTFILQLLMPIDHRPFALYHAFSNDHNLLAIIHYLSRSSVASVDE
jgi:hypothetical protein